MAPQTSIVSFTGCYEFLSNFWMLETPIRYKGILYFSTEHAFQAAKTLDKVERQNIADVASPGMAKRAGRSLTLRPNWDNLRVPIMRKVLRKKFEDPFLLVNMKCTRRLV